MLGPIHVYANPLTTGGSAGADWNVLGGYVGAACLFFSIIGVTFSNRVYSKTIKSRIPIFFFGISIFFLLKSFGFPVINLLGSLPIFEHVVFPRYDGFIWILGFAISAAFGIEIIQKGKISKLEIAIITIISSLGIIFLSLLIIPFTSDENLVGYYMISQVLLALFFLLACFLISLKFKNKNIVVYGIFFLILLELSLYIPLGLHPIWQFYRSLVVIVGVISIISTIFLIERKRNFNIDKNKITKIIVVIFIGTMIGQSIVYESSTIGLPLKHDAYGSTPLTDYLQKNLDNSRIFHLDSAFRPNYPAAYKIQSLGVIAAFNIDSYRSFVYNFLDPYASKTVFDYIPAWREATAPPLSDVFLENKKYYDFLGTKYIVTNKDNLDFSTTRHYPNFHLPLGDYPNGIGQIFKPKSEKIDYISIQLGTYGNLNKGKLVLTVDSIPFNEDYHRIATLDAEKVINGDYNVFEFPTIYNVYEKELFLNLSYPNLFPPNNMALFIHNKNSPDGEYVDSFINHIGGNLYINEKPYPGAMEFSISSTPFDLVYRGDYYHVYENKESLPRSFLVNKFHFVEPNEAQNFLKEDKTFNFKTNVILEERLPDHVIQSLNSSTLDETSFSKITSYSANKVMIEVNANNPAMLILTDNYYPGWKAFVDGNETHIYRADGLVRAVFIPLGNHIVEFSYMPESFVLGSIIASTTGGILLGILIFSKRMKARF